MCSLRFKCNGDELFKCQRFDTDSALYYFRRHDAYQFLNSHFRRPRGEHERLVYDAHNGRHAIKRNQVSQISHAIVAMLVRVEAYGDCTIIKRILLSYVTVALDK